MGTPRVSGTPGYTSLATPSAGWTPMRGAPTPQRSGTTPARSAATPLRTAVAKDWGKAAEMWAKQVRLFCIQSYVNDRFILFE